MRRESLLIAVICEASSITGMKASNAIGLRPLPSFLSPLQEHIPAVSPPGGAGPVDRREPVQPAPLNALPAELV